MSSSQTRLRILSAGAVRCVLPGLAEKFTAATGIEVNAVFGPVKPILARAENEPCDIVVLTESMLRQAAEDGLIWRLSMWNIAHVGLGVAVPTEASLPDISSVNAFEQALLHASKVACTDPTRATGGSLFAKIVERLGITDAIAAKKVVGASGKDTFALVVDGKAEIAVGMISEILEAQGVKLVGPVPMELQSVTTYTIGRTQKSGAIAAADRFIEFVSMPEHDELRAKAGLNFKIE